MSTDPNAITLLVISIVASLIFLDLARRAQRDAADQNKR